MSKTDKAKILLVDDNEDMCESLTDVITMDSAYNVSHTTNPLRALEMIRTGEFSLIIIDYKMPTMNGIELLKRIKQIKADFPVLVLTAFISDELTEQAEKNGAREVLSKFIRPDALLEHIKNAIA
ncbi:MAG: sigma-54-dependent Fis family transcriptional regulator [Candidatus Makaraimicrobium thalassicum]|nr:MAG: sigma-54-dependent Fis family transcriptional regulator [Candidatus Omnitrophota bacterium]